MRQEAERRAERIRTILLNKTESEFPKVGDKMIFSGVPKFYYPHFTDMGDKARKLLVVGQEYTLTKVEIYSSWCSVEVAGVEGHYNRMFFKNVEAAA